MRIENRTKQLARLGLCVASVLLCGRSALAQLNPETGDETPANEQAGTRFGGSLAGSAGTQTEPQAQAQRSWTPPTPVATPSPEPENSGMRGSTANLAAPPSDDHAAAVGHFGVGFFGVMTVPIMDCGMGAMCALAANNDVAAPTIGLRYWLSDRLGIEAAVGLNVSSSSSGSIDTSRLGFALHGGVPLALAHSAHFVFELVPQLGLGVASGSYKAPGTVPGSTTKTDLSGLAIEAGGKVGAEVHFGFMGLPQLSLQGTLGLMVRHDSRTAKTPIPIPGGGTSTVKQSQTVFATGVDASPWDIFRSSITAIYYFY
jgi:hypothetical protein